jgi:multidrug efflux pump subunit AcrA (membrane-fusion protein)
MHTHLFAIERILYFIRQTLACGSLTCLLASHLGAQGIAAAQLELSQLETPAVQTQTGKSRTAITVTGAILKTIEATSLAAEVSGTIQELQVKEGDSVAKGQKLGGIKDEAVRLELLQYKTQIEMARKKQANDINRRLAEKARQVADNEYQRAQNSNARVPDTYPINEIDRLKLIADQAQLEVERAIHDQDIAGFEVELALGNYRKSYELYLRHQITAPAEGVVVAVDKRIGEWVEPGTALLRIVRTDPLRVEGFITAGDIQGELVGKTAVVSIVDAVHQDSISGRVAFVSPDVNPVNSQVRVFIEVDNRDGKLRPGLRVHAQIEP